MRTRSAFRIAAVVAVLLLVNASVAMAAGTFSDDDGNTHEANIEAIAAEGITQGCNPPENDLYCPNDPVTRGQMAVFLARAFDYSDDGGGDLFVDDDGEFYETAADRIKTAGVTQGCNPPDNDMYCGDGFVTRGQMAAFLVRALGLTDDGGGDLFTDDDDSVFELAIDRLGTEGITAGCNPPDNDRFCPDELVTRAQMATFLTRALDLDPIAPGDFAEFTVQGSGNDVIDFQIPGDMPAVLDLVHDGSSNFVVWSLDGDSEQIDLLVNEIGTYDGRRMVHGGWFSAPEPVRHLDIEADGNWSITARPMSAADALTTSLNGSGDDIVRYESSASTLTSTHDGSSNFIIVGYESDGEYNGLIVNDIGSYSGTDLIEPGTEILDIQADGNWTLTAP